MLSPLAAISYFLILESYSIGPAQGVQDRITSDLQANRPIVVHVTVALCDNESQGIVPVPSHLGDGQDPAGNLYWGALYGLKTFFIKKAGWTKHATPPHTSPILERIVLYRSFKHDNRRIPVFVVADAWEGSAIEEAIGSFLEASAGRSTVSIPIGLNEPPLNAGGAAHLLAYIGHNGLMEFQVKSPAPPLPDALPRSAVVLACDSKSFFLNHLREAKAQALVLTTGLMAPEAYTLDAIITAWIEGKDATHAAAVAYERYQHCGQKAARNLFWGEP